MAAGRWQLAGQSAGATAEAGVVLVGAVPRVHNQLAVGEERIVGAVRVNVYTCGRANDLTTIFIQTVTETETETETETKQKCEKVSFDKSAKKMGNQVAKSVPIRQQGTG